MRNCSWKTASAAVVRIRLLGSPLPRSEYSLIHESALLVGYTKARLPAPAGPLPGRQMLECQGFGCSTSSIQSACAHRVATQRSAAFSWPYLSQLSATLKTANVMWLGSGTSEASLPRPEYSLFHEKCTYNKNTKSCRVCLPLLVFSSVPWKTANPTLARIWLVASSLPHQECSLFREKCTSDELQKTPRSNLDGLH